MKKNSPEKNELLYDTETASNDIISWMTHVLRGCQQDLSKTFVVNDVISDTTTFWLKDWSQKISPQSYREKQQDYFGEKGISLHVDVFFTKSAAHNSSINYRKQFILLF